LYLTWLNISRVEYRGPLPVPEVTLSDLSFGVALGYSESKLVAEHIVEVAHNKAGLETQVIRVGQLTGGIGGSWNTKEWLPAVLQVSQKIGFLPNVDSKEVPPLFST
jgi:thioester reductase-like protein